MRIQITVNMCVDIKEEQEQEKGKHEAEREKVEGKEEIRCIL